jgi:L-ribulokinase
VAAGAYPDVTSAAAAMGRLEEDAFQPDPARHEAYLRLYREYAQLHDWFGRGGNDVMRRLATLRREVLSDAHTDD